MPVARDRTCYRRPSRSRLQCFVFARWVASPLPPKTSLTQASLCYVSLSIGPTRLKPHTQRLAYRAHVHWALE